LTFLSAPLINCIVGLIIVTASKYTYNICFYCGDNDPGENLSTFFVFATLYSYKYQDAAATVVLAVAAQLVTVLVLDSFGLKGASGPIDIQTLFGATLLVIGSLLVVR
jgi:hypothetical protein